LKIIFENRIEKKKMPLPNERFCANLEVYRPTEPFWNPRLPSRRHVMCSSIFWIGQGSGEKKATFISSQEEKTRLA